MIGPEFGPFPRGASLTANPAGSGLRGQHHLLPGGYEPPRGFGIVSTPSAADLTHHTFFPTVRMSVEAFVEAFLNLPWRYGGKIK